MLEDRIVHATRPKSSYQPIISAETMSRTVSHYRIEEELGRGDGSLSRDDPWAVRS